MPRPNPEIRIQYAWLLYHSVSKFMATYLGLDLPSEKSVLDSVEKYKNAWADYEYAILAGMQECCGLSFYKNVIDVHVAPYIKPISSPLSIHTKHASSGFIDVLTHELFHVLFTDNNENASFPDKTMLQRYPEEDCQTRSHIPVHAGLKYIYLDVLNEPDRLETDIQRCKNDLPTGYTRAWEIVQDGDYTQIIREFSEAAKQ